MSYEYKEGSGSLFKNKKTKDTQPDMQGECKIGGKIYRISAWTKEGKAGKWLSLSVQLPRPVSRDSKTNDDPPPFDDDLEF